MPETTHNHPREQDRLAVELEFYAAHKQQWLKVHRGEFVVIHDSNVLGFYTCWGKAFGAGVGAFGVQQDLLVKQVLVHELVCFVY
jgi:hypothetical protein